MSSNLVNFGELALRSSPDLSDQIDQQNGFSTIDLDGGAQTPKNSDSMEISDIFKGQDNNNDNNPDIVKPDQATLALVRP